MGDLAGIRDRIKAANAESSAEARRRVRRRRGARAGLPARARAEVRGGVGTTSIVWRCPFVVRYISEHTWDPLPLAALFPDRMLALVMGEVERMAMTGCRWPARTARRRAGRKLDELHRVERRWLPPRSRLATPCTSPSTPPAAVLGVGVAEDLARRLINEDAARIRWNQAVAPAYFEPSSELVPVSFGHGLANYGASRKASGRSFS
jgi:hypothetical protein